MINKKKLYRVARRVKDLIELDLMTRLDSRFFIFVDPKEHRIKDAEYAKGLIYDNNIIVIINNITKDENLYEGFIKTVAHELRHAWQDEQRRVNGKILKKYFNIVKRKYPELRSLKTESRMEADAFQYEDYFFKKYSSKIRKF